MHYVSEKGLPSQTHREQPSADFLSMFLCIIIKEIWRRLINFVRTRIREQILSRTELQGLTFE